MISNRMHALLDGVSAAALALGPTALRWPRRLRGPLAAAGTGVAAYSLLTRYHRTSLAPLSMQQHLRIDAAQGAAFLGAAALMRGGRSDVRGALAGYGLFSIAASLLTEAPPDRRLGAQIPVSRRAIPPMRGRRVHPVAQDVAWRRLAMVNVVFLGPGGAGDRGWVLVDAGLRGTAGMIEAAAAERFGEGVRPAAIILTHGHFDHVGALETLVRRWDVPVFAHKLERPYLTGRARYPLPDPSTGGGLMAALSRFFPTAPVDVSHALHPLPLDGGIPGAPGWKWLHTPGHAPGHVSLWRESDRALIAGDAVITTRQESAYAVATQAPEMHGPPAYFTIEWDKAAGSARRLAALEPELLVTGHGRPMRGPRMRAALHRLAARFNSVAVPHGARYVRQPARPGAGAYR